MAQAGGAAGEGTGELARLPEAPAMGALARSLPMQVMSTGGQTAVDEGSVRGQVTDPGGAVVRGTVVDLVRGSGADPAVVRSCRTDEGGNFALSGVPAGTYELRVQAAGFAEARFPAVVKAGETLEMPEMRLAVAGVDTAVNVTLTRTEVAQAQVEQETKQRVLGAIPNFYVSYERHPAPLSARQKYWLAWKTVIDPVSFGITGVAAGVEQATDTYDGYGQGAAGYGRRYGAGYGDLVSGTMLGSAILPALFKQDPRYFYQGTGSVRSRALHAMQRSVLTQSDSGHRQIDFSGLLGGLAAAGIANAYHPAEDREGASLTFQDFGIGIAGSAAQNLLQEFLVKKLSRGLPPMAPTAAGEAR